MDDIFHFIINHWILSTLFILFILAYILIEMRSGRASDEISPEAAVQLINHQEALVVDIRNENAFAEGHIVGAINIPASILDKKLNQLQKHAGKPILLICSAGNSTKEACIRLKQQGIEAKGISGGLQAWRAASLPLTKKS